MRIALTYNLRLSDSEEEAEFDTQETVNALAGAIERLGHRLERFEVSGPASRTVARLEAYSPGPHLQHRRGTARPLPRGVLPGALRRAGLPLHRVATPTRWRSRWTSSSPSSSSASTASARRAGSSSRSSTSCKAEELHFPVIVKPNFEGSSKGITQDSVAETVAELKEKVAAALERYPAGVLVEEYISGRDLTVPVPGRGGERLRRRARPGGVRHRPRAAAPSARYHIYDYELKTSSRQAVSVKAPGRDHRRACADRAARAPRRRSSGVLDCRDLGRIDFRLSRRGRAVLPRDQRAAVARAGRRHLRRRRARGAALRRGDRLGHPERRAALQDQGQLRAARASRTRKTGRCGWASPSTSSASSPPRTRWRTREAEYDCADARCRPSARPSPAGATRWSTSRRTRSCPRVLAVTPRRHGLQHRRGLQGPQPREPGAGAARAARHPLHRLATRRRSRSRWTRRWPRRSSASTASTPRTSS